MVCSAMTAPAKKVAARTEKRILNDLLGWWVLGSVERLIECDAEERWQRADSVKEWTTEVKDDQY